MVCSKLEEVDYAKRKDGRSNSFLPVIIWKIYVVSNPKTAVTTSAMRVSIQWCPIVITNITLEKDDEIIQYSLPNY